MAGLVVLAVVLGLAAAFVILSSGQGDDEDASSASNAPTSTDAPATDSTDGSGDDGSADDTVVDPPATTVPAPVTILDPSSVVPSNTRNAVDLLCGGHADYEARNLFDRDPNTGWGASNTDGTGQSVTMSFPAPVHVTSVGITPGYIRNGPRSDQGCTSVNAFMYNRFIPEVEWRFDDGSERQTFDQVPELQRLRVDHTTRTITMVIVGTVASPWDDDTVISSMEVRGSA